MLLELCSSFDLFKACQMVRLTVMSFPVTVMSFPLIADTGSSEYWTREPASWYGGGREGGRERRRGGGRRHLGPCRRAGSQVHSVGMSSPPSAGSGWIQESVYTADGQHVTEGSLPSSTASGTGVRAIQWNF